MKARWIVLIAMVAVVVALGTGLALAGQHGATGWDGSDMMGTFEAMHRSPAMQRTHAQMPGELREQCEAMHAQMGPMMEQMEGMMGSGMADHHGSGGMMGRWTGGLMGPGMMESGS